MTHAKFEVIAKLIMCTRDEHRAVAEGAGRHGVAPALGGARRGDEAEKLARVVRRLAKGADGEARNADLAQPAQNGPDVSRVRTRAVLVDARRACRSYSPTTRRARELTAAPRAAAAPLVSTYVKTTT